MARKLFLIIIFVCWPYLLFASPPANNCTLKKQECLSPNQTRLISGINVFRDCWEYKTTYDCPLDTYTNYCAVIEAINSCTQVNSVCSQYDSAHVCNNFTNEFTCGNLLAQHDNIIKILSSYTLVKDELDSSNCNDYSNCQMIKESCIEPAATKIISGQNIYKNCWQYKKEYSCFAPTFSDCTDLASRCTLKTSTCLTENISNHCLSEEKSYLCPVNSNSANKKQLICGSQIYCVSGNCQQVNRENNNNFSSALSSFSTLKELQDQINNSDLKIFQGNGFYCSKNILGFNNCCKDDGWGQDIGLASCSSSERQLIEEQDSGLCTYIGTYCSKKILGICKEKRKSYCCFPSKLSRIVHEQGRAQLDINWGDAENPNCRAITITELQQLDLSQIDFSEIYEDLSANYREINNSKTQDNINQEIRDYYK